MIQSRQIEAFRAVMLTGGMTSAAEMIHVTQPAVSRLVRDLERELGLVLFQRNGNQVSPTPQAHALLEEVERSFIGLQHIRDFAEQLRAGRSGVLKIGALPAMAAGFLPRFVARYSRERPEIRILVDGLPSTIIREDVIHGRLDLGLSVIPFTSNVLSATLFEDHAVVVFPTGHRLAAQPRVRAQDLQDENLVLLTKFAHARHPVELALQSVRRGKVIDTPQAAIACILVSEGAGVAIVDPFSAAEFVGRGIEVRPFEPAAVVGTGIVHSTERPLSAEAAEFRTAFIDHVDDFLKQQMETTA